MPFSRMACDIQINVHLVRFKHTEKEEMTVENKQMVTPHKSWLPYSSSDPSDFGDNVCC